jgi:8-oxo-dGTP pyrophosphatase MutT (NUDIX family)
VDPRRRLPDALLEAARGFADGSREPVLPRDASTVVLMRDGRDDVEVYLLRRHSGMEFAGGFCVFPGGGVDPRDFDTHVGWAGPSAAEWAALLDADEETARALVCAAVRETFEEAGVLLAGPSATTVVDDTTGPEWERGRQALVSRDLAFSEFLEQRGLVLRTDLLRLWGSWVTPAFEPKRFDARFFVAQLPTGQVTRDVSTESDAVVWLSAKEAVQAVLDERITMLPPTYCTCMEVAELPTAAAVLEAASGRDLTPVEPALALDEDGAYLELPQRLLDLGERFAVP